MGVYTRKDSPFYQLWLETRPRGRKEATHIRKDAPSAAQRRDNERSVWTLYHARMAELNHDALLVRAKARSTVLPERTPPLRAAMTGWCYIYVAQAGDRIKIGRCLDVKKRLKALQTGNGHELRLLGAIPAHAVIERLIHERFADLRISGEWYEPKERLLGFVQQIVAGVNPIALLWGGDGPTATAGDSRPGAPAGRR